jgi:hypothetical protein
MKLTKKGNNSYLVNSINRVVFAVETQCVYCQVGTEFYIHDVSGGKVNILGGHSIGHSKQKRYMYMCPIPHGFRGTALSLYRRATRHIITRVAKCIDVDGGIVKNVLY